MVGVGADVVVMGMVCSGWSTIVIGVGISGKNFRH